MVTTALGHGTKGVDRDGEENFAYRPTASFKNCQDHNVATCLVGEYLVGDGGDVFFKSFLAVANKTNNTECLYTEPKRRFCFISLLFEKRIYLWIVAVKIIVWHRNYSIKFL